MSFCFTAAFGIAIAASCAVMFAVPADAEDGQLLINQARALAGGLTPGDTPGFPVTISLSGSYRFSGNLQVTALKNGIEVNADEVTIDLNGFRLDGGGVANRGIRGNQRGLTVRNGTIRKFTNDGILNLGPLMIVEHMRISENANDGVGNAGDVADSCRIVNSTITSNDRGIVSVRDCHVEGNIVSDNRSDGIQISGGTVLGNTITRNRRFGITIFGANPVGVGNNTVVGNGLGQIAGPIIKLHPNACAPVACP